MGEPYLTMAEIEAKYPDEWVLLTDLRVGRSQQLLGGRVLAHDPDRDRMHDAVMQLPGRETIAVRFTGRPADDEELLL